MLIKYQEHKVPMPNARQVLEYSCKGILIASLKCKTQVLCALCSIISLSFTEKCTLGKSIHATEYKWQVAIGKWQMVLL
jgi:hypothetical protein